MKSGTQIGGNGAAERPTKPSALAQRPTSNAQHPTSNGVGVRQFDLEERLLRHATEMVRVFDALPDGGARLVGNQLIRSGTSPYLHHGEVEAAESRADFVHKLSVCLKELRETWRALRLLKAVDAICIETADRLIDETQQLIRIFWKGIQTTRSRTANTDRVAEGEADDWMFDVGRWTLDVEPKNEASLDVGRWTLDVDPTEVAP